MLYNKTVCMRVLTVSPWQSSRFFFITFIAFAEVEEDEHV